MSDKCCSNSWSLLLGDNEYLTSGGFPGCFVMVGWQAEHFQIRQLKVDCCGWNFGHTLVPWSWCRWRGWVWGWLRMTVVQWWRSNTPRHLLIWLHCCMSKAALSQFPLHHQSRHRETNSFFWTNPQGLLLQWRSRQERGWDIATHPAVASNPNGASRPLFLGSAGCGLWEMSWPMAVVFWY